MVEWASTLIQGKLAVPTQQSGRWVDDEMATNYRFVPLFFIPNTLSMVTIIVFFFRYNRVHQGQPITSTCLYDSRWHIIINVEKYGTWMDDCVPRCDRGCHVLVHNGFHVAPILRFTVPRNSGLLMDTICVFKQRQPGASVSYGRFLLWAGITLMICSNSLLSL